MGKPEMSNSALTSNGNLMIPMTTARNNPDSSARMATTRDATVAVDLISKLMFGG